MYCDVTDILARINKVDLNKICDDDGDGLYDASVIDSAIMNASGIVDGYIAVYKDVPLSVVPALIRSITADIVCSILAPRGHKYWIGSAIYDDLTARGNKATYMLYGIHNGTIAIDDDTSLLNCYVEARERDFNDGVWERYWNGGVGE